MTAQIKSISISGIRTLDHFTLELDGLTVLIGENGSGKSTIIETCELLRRLTNQNFHSEYNSIHGGDSMLLRMGESEIKLGVTIRGNPWTAYYEVRFNWKAISEETLHVALEKNLTEKIQLLQRTSQEATITRLGSTPETYRCPAQVPVIALQGWPNPDDVLQTVNDALSAIDVHLPFSTSAYWATKSQGSQTSPLRDSMTIAPTTRLDRFGANLANAYYSLKNESPDSDWDVTMELVRLGLGHWVESVNLRPDAGGGRIALWIKPRHIDKQIPTTNLSDGQLAYLAFVAIARLSDSRSLLCFDELELHLHPRLLTRVVDLMVSISEKTPVLLTTQSRAVLDQLANPAQSVAVLKLDQEKLRTVVRRLDETVLDRWLEEYEGLGQVAV